MTGRFEKMARAMGKQTAFEEFEKTAFLGPLKALWGGAKALGSWAGKGIEGTLGGLGQSAVKAVEESAPGVAKYMRIAGHKVPRDMWQFGAFGGGIGALTNPEDRLGGFAKGFAGGALGGLGWRAGGNLARHGLRKGFRAMGKSPSQWYTRTVGAQGKLFRPLTKAERAAQKAAAKAGTKADVPGLWARRRFGEGRDFTYGRAAKNLGARVGLGALPLGAAFYGSDLTTPSFEGAPPGPHGITPQAYYAMRQAMQQPRRHYPQAQAGYPQAQRFYV